MTGRHFAARFSRCALAAALVAFAGCSPSSGGPAGETVNLTIGKSTQTGAADAKAESIVRAANAFLATLSKEQADKVLYAFDDNAQRARWSNFPVSFVERGGLNRGEMTAPQLAALDALLGEVMSADGLRNVRMQMAADDTLVGGDGPPADFGSKFYYVAMLGNPATDAPWMLQFGGHHLALNITMVGAKASFSPMLTGGQPLTIDFEGKKVYITQREVDASRAFLASLDAKQRTAAIRGSEAIDILIGPGEYGTVIADEGVRGADLSEQQRALLLAVVEARLGQLNARDAARKMDEVRGSIADTWFAWWGPTDKPGQAYFRVTGPAVMLEYGPQSLGGSLSEHTHNMYREPSNDYGAQWIAAKPGS